MAKAFLVHGEEVFLKINEDSELAKLPIREMPEFSKAAGEKIDITCLNDTVMKSVEGITDYSSNELSFKMLYTPALFDKLDKLGEGQDGEDGEKADNVYVVTLSCGSTFTLEGTHTVTYHGGGMNTAAEMSIVIALSKAPVFKVKGN